MRILYATLCFAAFSAASAPRVEAAETFCAEAPAYCDAGVAPYATVTADALSEERAAFSASDSRSDIDQRLVAPRALKAADTETADPGARTVGVQFLETDDLNAVNSGVRRLDEQSLAGVSLPNGSLASQGGATFNVAGSTTSVSGGTAVNLNVSVRVGE